MARDDTGRRDPLMDGGDEDEMNIDTGLGEDTGDIGNKGGEVGYDQDQQFRNQQDMGETGTNQRGDTTDDFDID